MHTEGADALLPQQTGLSGRRPSVSKRGGNQEDSMSAVLPIPKELLIRQMPQFTLSAKAHA
jgi:hypothetical protein